MRKVVRLVIVAAAGAVAALSAWAGAIGSVELRGGPGTFVNYSFTDPGGVPYTYSVSPYSANLTGVGFSPGYVTCLDFANPNALRVVYTGTWVTPSTNAEIAASWLADRLYGLTPVTADAAFVGPISMAIWTIMFPSSTNAEGLPGVPVDPAAAGWVSQAFTAVSGGYVPDTLEFIPDDTTSQRFMLNPGTVPEPASFILAGSCILLAGVLRRKMFKG